MAARCTVCRVKEPEWGTVCRACRARAALEGAQEARMVQSHLVQDIDAGLGLEDAIRDPRAAGLRVERLLKCYRSGSTRGLKWRIRIMDEARLDPAARVRELEPWQVEKVLEFAEVSAWAKERKARPERRRKEAAEKKAKGRPFVRRTVETPEGARLREESARMKAETLARWRP